MRENHEQRIRKAFKMRPASALNVVEWADTFRGLPASTSAVPGRWDTARVEVARGPMLAVTEPGVSTVTVKSCTQLLKTELLLNIVGFFAHQRPGPMLLTQPKEAAVKSFSKERLAAMVRVTPVLRDIISDVNRDKSGDGLQYKEFPGGFIALESAGSPTNLASRPIKITLQDEIDKYETTKEGDPVLLAEERTSTFPDALHVRCCSPTLEETSRIERSYNESDQRRPFVACPHCAHEQTLEFFKHVNWNKSEDGKEHYPATAAIYCESCGAEWSEIQRLTLMTTKGAIVWRQTRPFTCCGEAQEPIKTRHWNADGRALCTKCNRLAVPNTHAGFAASKLYSPTTTVATLAEKWIQSKDNIESRQVFFNTQLGQAFSAQSARKVEAHVLASRRETFLATVPQGVLRLTAGVDTQDDRLEVHIVGWGHPLEAWSVDYQILAGDPSKPEIWRRLDELLLKRFMHEAGVELRISATCVDSGGHNTESVYKFCKARAARNVWAIKGSSWSRQGDPVWPPKRSRRTRITGYKPIILAVDSAKDHLRQMLLTDEAGPGFVHIPIDRSDEWLEQLTAEQCIFESKAGATTRRWKLPKGRANEAGDTLVYSYAALRGLEEERGLRMERASWQHDAFVAAAAKAAEPDAATQTPPLQYSAPPESARVRRSKWL